MRRRNAINLCAIAISRDYHMIALKMSFSDEAIEQAMTWATKELGYSGLRKKQKLAVASFVRGSDVLVFILSLCSRLHLLQGSSNWCRFHCSSLGGR